MQCLNLTYIIYRYLQKDQTQYKRNSQVNPSALRNKVYNIKIYNSMMEKGGQKNKQKAIREVQKNARYYENQYPKQGELVMVQCTACQQNGCYVELLQYEKKKGMVPYSQYTTSMKRNLQRAMKVGRVEVARVTKVDTNKGYIDLSKSKVNQQDQNQCHEKFAKSRALHSIIINITADAKQALQVYNNIVWPLYINHPNVHPHDLIKQIIIKQQKADEYGFTDPKLKADLCAELKRRYKKPVVKSIGIFKVSVKSFDGILQIKQILKAGVQASKAKQFDVKITILGAPDYLCEISASTKQQGQQALMLALDKIKEQATQVNGEFEIIQKPKVVGDSNHAIHQIYAEQMDNQDQADEDEQMGDEDQA